jgi:hypothetical protein
MIQINETRWQEMLADRRRLIGEIRTMRHIIHTLMRAAAFHHAATAPQEPFPAFVGLTEAQYAWWLADIINAELGPPEEN